ncbi:MAG: Coenzyme F420 hydrogenase/dehydrogenase, beta subunit C-terminal domain, partial [Candidatus Jordarchaeaceae archaeon]
QINEKLRKKIALHIGLFCNHTPDFSATESFLHRIKVKKEDITELRYRGSGWPGFMKISLKNGRTIKVALPLYWKFLGLDFFIPRSCLLCNDGLNELADLSFGDAWLPSVLSKDNMGASIVVVRSITGENIIQGARKYGKVKLTKISPEEVVKSQLSNIYFKKVILKSRAKFLGMSFSNNIIETGVLDSIYALFCILNSQFLSKSIFFKFILKKAPMKIINSYYLFPNFLYSKMLNNFRKKLLIDV